MPGMTPYQHPSRRQQRLEQVRGLVGQIPACLRSCRRFGQAEYGGVMVLWGVLFIVLFGFVALSFDIGRIANTQSELQSFVDNVAITAAGELDGAGDAIVRATAAANLVIDSQTFGVGGGAPQTLDLWVEVVGSVGGGAGGSGDAGIFRDVVQLYR